MDLSNNYENGGVNGMKVVPNEVKLVRIIWVDASGHHRCRVRFYFIFRIYLFNLESFL